MRLAAGPRISLPLAIFGLLFVAAEIVKFLRGDSQWGTIDAVLAVVFVALCALTRRFTNGAAPNPVERGRFLPLQLACCAIAVAGTGLNLPGWSNARTLLFAAAAAHMPSDIANGVTNLVLFCLPIALALGLLGISLRQQGLGPFKRGSAASAAAWVSLPLAVFVWALASGRATFPAIGTAWLSNLLQNGFSEEFLWRGAILGRLRAVMSGEWAILVQALLFGLWHADYDLRSYHGDVVSAAADMIASQALFGMAAGYVTVQTGNIAISSAFHLLFDSLQILQ